jgi:hypothetical protein
MVEAHCKNSDLRYHCCLCYTLRVRSDLSPQFALSRGYQRSELLTSPPVFWHEEHLWNFGVLQRVHLSNLVRLSLLMNVVYNAF